MICKILWRMYGAADGRRQTARRGRNFEENLGKLKTIVERLSREGPYRVRIITLSKYFSGRLDKVELNGEELKFRIRGCHRDGSSNGTAGVFEKTVNLREISDFQIAADKKGKTVFLSDLFPNFFNENGDLTW